MQNCWHPGWRAQRARQRAGSGCELGALSGLEIRCLLLEALVSLLDAAWRLNRLLRGGQGGSAQSVAGFLLCLWGHKERRVWREESMAWTQERDSWRRHCGWHQSKITFDHRKLIKTQFGGCRPCLNRMSRYIPVAVRALLSVGHGTPTPATGRKLFWGS